MTREELIEAMATAGHEAKEWDSDLPAFADMPQDYREKTMAIIEAALSAIEQAGLIERAFKDGLAYGSNVDDADPDLAWQRSRIRHDLEGRL